MSHTDYTVYELDPPAPPPDYGHSGDPYGGQFGDPLDPPTRTINSSGDTSYTGDVGSGDFGSDQRGSGVDLSSYVPAPTFDPWAPAPITNYTSGSSVGGTTKVKWNSTVGTGYEPPIPSVFIAGVTSPERRSHLNVPLRVNPHRRFS